MKFVASSWVTYHIESEEQCELIISVAFKLGGRGFFKLDPFGKAWVFDADEHFPMFCKIKHGFAPIPLQDHEYRELAVNGIVFLSKMQTTEAKRLMLEMMPTR